MNPVVTSKEEILAASRELIRTRGWQAVNIRAVAAACGVSVGSIYNYYDSKSSLTAATVESVWCEIFHRPSAEPADTLACLRWMYERMAWGAREYPGFFSLRPFFRRIFRLCLIYRPFLGKRHFYKAHFTVQPAGRVPRHPRKEK